MRKILCDKLNKRKCLVCVCAVLVSLQMAGCSATELEDRCFPMMAVVDYRINQVEFAYGFPQLSQKENTDVEESKVDAPMTPGADFVSAHERYRKELDKKADCNHMKVLVLSEEFMQQSDVYAQTIEYLQQSELFPRNVYVCVTDDIAELLKTESDLPTDLGSYLETYLNNHEPESDAELVNLGTLIDESENHIKTLQLPYLTVEEGAILWDRSFPISKDFVTNNM